MPTSADVLSWATLTQSVNNMFRPNDFLKNKFFGRDKPVATRDIELTFLDRGRKIAPFVERDGEAIMTTGRTESKKIVSPPHIRIKRPMTPTDLLTKRRKDSVIYPGADGISQAMKEYMADEMSMMMDDILNSEEYMCALALRGAISYTSQDEASFTVTFPRAAGHDITLAGADLWTASTASFRKNFLDAARLINAAVSLNITDVVMGTEALDAFLADAPGELEKNLDTRRLSTGTIDLTTQFAESGAMYHGTYTNGINIWSYPRTVEVAGVSTDLIRPKYIEFVANSPAAEFVVYYGAIEDMKAIGEGNVLVSKRFSKTWDQEDPSRRMILVESNPLPVMRRPNATLSMKVVA